LDWVRDPFGAVGALLPLKAQEELIDIKADRTLRLQFHELSLDTFWLIGKEEGRAMAQAVSRWPLTAEARVRARVVPCGICGGQSGTGQVFSEYFGFPCKYHSTIAPYSSITAP
jgi:hypothetical protein